MARENSGRNSLIFRGVVGNKSYILEKSESSWGILCSSLIIIWIWEINGRMNNLLIKLSTASLRIPKREHIEQIIDQWTWVWVNPRSWWWTGRPGDMESYHRVGYDWATDLNCGHQKSENSILNKTVCLSCKASSCITSVSPLCSPTRYPVRSSYCKLLTLSTCLEALGSWQPWE